VITVLLVLVGGGGGAIARFAVDAAVQARRLGEFPFGTLAVNLGGSLVLGLLVGLPTSHRAMVILGTATIGSYTTFSTWLLETHRPAEDGEVQLAWLNITVGLAAGLAAAAVGKAIGGAL
jgi:fluoride exporter